MASDNKALHSTIPTLEPVADMAARADAALVTFRRAMRRYERRARAMGTWEGAIVSDKLAALRCNPELHADEDLAEWHSYAVRWGHRTGAFLFERAAAAVARLREATS